MTNFCGPQRLAQLSAQLLEVARLEAEGRSPPEELARLRWIANESFRQGREVGEAEYEKAHAPPPAPAETAEKERVHEPREWKPRPPQRDVLRDYRGNPDYQRTRLEPEFT